MTGYALGALRALGVIWSLGVLGIAACLAAAALIPDSDDLADVLVSTEWTDPELTVVPIMRCVDRDCTDCNRAVQ